MPKDPFDPFAGITGRLLEQDGLSMTLGRENYLSEVARTVAGISSLQDQYGSSFAARAAELSAASQLVREATMGLAQRDLSVVADFAASSRSLLDQVAALDLAPTARHVADLAAGMRGHDLAFRSTALLGERFRLPELEEMTRISRELQTFINDTYGLDRSSLIDTLSSMRQPWLDMRDTEASMMGFAKLQGIGHLIGTAPTFDGGVASLLRADFGDWRDRITWPGDLGADLSVRAGLYLERGFNPAITDFPTEAFDEGLEASGLHENRPALVTAYGEPVPSSDEPDVEESFARNNLVHDWLQRFETQIRRFIDQAMTALHGSDWPRHRLPNGLYDKWLDKQSKDTSGRGWPLIYYADFTDYELVICRDDNWKGVFRAHFARPELVRESLQRLYPTRLATMHARPLLPEDELFAFAEITRLIRRFTM